MRTADSEFRSAVAAAGIGKAHPYKKVTTTRALTCGVLKASRQPTVAVPIDENDDGILEAKGKISRVRNQAIELKPRKKHVTKYQYS
jgi:hypothetical protein